jgi:hypothetical protein
MLVLAACAGPATHPVSAPEPVAPGQPVEMVAPAPDVVIEVSGVASRSAASPRVLRRIVAARHGAVELPRAHVSLIVKRVVSGPIDPDYGKRPVGANRLFVVLLDEAAHAAPGDFDGFEGTWRLAKLADGTLVASAIEDTPLAGDAGRRAEIAEARRSLRDPLPVPRMHGIELIANHGYLELVPDLIAIVNDDRRIETTARGTLAVGDAAHATLVKLVEPLGVVAPQHRDADAWDKLWRDLTTRIDPITVTPSTAGELARLAMNQSWPELAVTANGFALGVSRLETPFDNHTDGLALIAGDQRTWLATKQVEGLDTAVSPSGTTALVFSEPSGDWRLVVDGKPRTLPRNITRLAHCAIAASDDGWLVTGVDGTHHLYAVALAANGQPRGASQTIPLDDAAEGNYHRAIHPVAVARRRGAWMVVYTRNQFVELARLDDKLRLTSSIEITDIRMQPRIATSGDRTFVAGISRTQALGTALVDDKRIVTATQTGGEVQLASKPVPLDDGGFAVAWIEAREVHVGRWSRDGERVANVVVQVGDVSQFAIALTRNGNELVVAYEDEARYPYTIVTRRLVTP